MKKKILSLTLVVCLLAIAVVGGTLAYFTDYTDNAVNTFTVGKVEITLDETDVDEYGVPVEPANRNLENEYKLIPGHTYVKDPTVTVVKESEPAYVRMVVKGDALGKLKAVFTENDFPTYYKDGLFLLEKLCTDETGETTWSDAWECVGLNATGDYEFRYVGKHADDKGVVDAREAEENIVLEDLFTHITLPGGLTNTQVEALDELVITVYGEAIQADGFDTADLAWEQFAREVKENA